VASARAPLPRRFTTSSFSQGMSSAVAPGALPTALAVTALPSLCSQVGPGAVRPSCHRGEASRSVRGTPRRGCRRCQPCIHRSAHPQHGVSQPWPRPARQSPAASVLWRRGPGMRPLKSVESVSAVAALSILSLVGLCLPTCFALSLASISQAKATYGSCIDLSPDAQATGPANAQPNHLARSVLTPRRSGSRPHHFAKSVLSLRRSGTLLDEYATCGRAPGVDGCAMRSAARKPST
jgi:hypothetical protein